MNLSEKGVDDANKFKLAVSPEMHMQAMTYWPLMFCFSAMNFLRTNHHFNEDKNNDKQVKNIMAAVFGEKIYNAYEITLPECCRITTHTFGVLGVEIWFRASHAAMAVHHFFETRAIITPAGCSKVVTFSHALNAMQLCTWFGFFYNKHHAQINKIHAVAKMVKADPYKYHINAKLYGVVSMKAVDCSHEIELIAPYVLGYLEFSSLSLGKSLALKSMKEQFKDRIESFKSSLNAEQVKYGESMTPSEYFMDEEDR